MEENYYVFKFNLQPRILEIYDYDTQPEHVISQIIPGSLKDIFCHHEEIDDEKIKFSDNVDIEKVRESDLYYNMVEACRIMTEMYYKVVQDFNDGKGITYSPEYLEQRDELKISINDLVDTYPFLKGSFDVKKNVFPINSFSKIKMSVAYIKKAKQIEYFLNNFTVEVSDMRFVYDTVKELIYIPAEKYSMEESIDFSELIEDQINRFSKDSNIGHVSINPVYEEIILEGMYPEITIELVYPNGDPARDRSRAIEEADIAKKKTKLEASQNAKIDASKLSKYYEEDAKKGYIKSVTSHGKSIIRSFIKTIKF